MASNRSNARSRSADRVSSDGVSSETTKDAVAQLARHTARIQLAAVAAAGRVVGGWAHAADRFASTVADELLRRVNGETDSSELVVRVTAAADAHLRELTALPRTAADHFDTRLARVPTNK